MVRGCTKCNCTCVYWLEKQDWIHLRPPTHGPQRVWSFVRVRAEAKTGFRAVILNFLDQKYKNTLLFFKISHQQHKRAPVWHDNISWIFQLISKEKSYSLNLVPLHKPFTPTYSGKGKKTLRLSTAPQISSIGSTFNNITWSSSEDGVCSTVDAFSCSALRNFQKCMCWLKAAEL